jgi:hypothetical protein
MPIIVLIAIVAGVFAIGIVKTACLLFILACLGVVLDWIASY